MLGQHTRVRTSTLSDIAPLFNTSYDARFLGATGSKRLSGQSDLSGANPSQASPLCGVVIDIFSLNFLLSRLSVSRAEPYSN
jgi:hypothetical protein